jgi:hypothetical protein
MRVIYLSSIARSFLEGLNTPRKGYIFSSEREDGSRRNIYLYEFFEEVCQSIGLTDVKLSDLRRTYGAIAITSGENHFITGLLMGYKSPETMLRALGDSNMKAHGAVREIEAGMTAGNQTQSACMAMTGESIKKLRPGFRDYTRWDTTCPRLGIRVKSTGEKLYVFFGRNKERLLLMIIGDAELMTLAHARADARKINIDEGDAETSLPRPTLSEWCSDIFWPEVSSHYTPKTYREHKGVINGQLLKHMGAELIDEIDQAVITSWVKPYSLKAPSRAKYALGMLNYIFNHAMAAGMTDNNPVPQIQRTLNLKWR